MYILLVEDDKFFQDFYAFKFREKNIEIEVAEDGEVALQKLGKRLPDIMLLDLIMPNKDGFDVLQEMTNRQLLGKIPVIVFSTLGQEKDITRALQMGATGYVNKSFFDFDRLLSKILELSKKQ